MAITVLYQECGSGCQEVPGDLGSSGSSYSGGRGNYYNAFELAPTSGGRMVTVADLVKAFPLGPSYHFDIMRRDGVFESIHELDLGSPVPILANGVITCRCGITCVSTEKSRLVLRKLDPFGSTDFGPRITSARESLSPEHAFKGFYTQKRYSSRWTFGI